MSVVKKYVYKNGVRIIESEGKELNNADYILDKLRCSILESEDVIEYDKLTDNKGKSEEHLKNLGVIDTEVVPLKAPKQKPRGIENDDLQFLLEIIRANFQPNERFKNNDVAKLQTKFTNRQTPSRLKKLVESGNLFAEGTPKNYYYI